MIAGPCSVEGLDPLLEDARGQGRRCDDAARRRVQAPHLALRLPGLGTEGIMDLVEARKGNRPAHRVGTDGNRGIWTSSSKTSI